MARLLDEEHAAIVETMAASLAEAGWQVEAESSYSEYGERGRIDLLAFDQASRVLAVVEVKTELADLQELFGNLNAKARLAPGVGRRNGWNSSRVMTVPAAASGRRSWLAGRRRVRRKIPA